MLIPLAMRMVGRLSRRNKLVASIRRHRRFATRPLYRPRIEGLEFRRLLALPQNFQDTLILGNLNQPVDIQALPNDNRMLVLERDGTIWITNPTTNNPSKGLYLQVPNVDNDGEKGLLSITLDPNFSINNYFYTYYHNTLTDRARISRFTHDQDHAHASDEKVVWEDSIVTSTQVISDHWGGAFDFGPDGNLYLAIGDKKDNPTDSQILSKSAGKIIRVDPSNVDTLGQWDFNDTRGNSGVNAHLIPNDNPFIDGAGPNLDEIWARGLRNPFRGEWDPVWNKFFIGEVGGNEQANTPDPSDEDIHAVTLANAGANFGWPDCEGLDSPNQGCTGTPPLNYSAPIFSIEHIDSRAIVAGPVNHTNLFPSTYANALFIADFTRGWLRYLKFDQNGNLANDNPVGGYHFSANGDLGNPVALEFGNDGLYYVDIVGRNATGGGEFRRISFNSGNQPPVIASASATPQFGTATLQVTFNGTASDPEGDPMTYVWDFGDGTQTSGQVNSNGTIPQKTHNYTSNGAYVATLQVSDANRTSVSEPIQIEVGIPPVPVVNAPANGSMFSAGELISIRGNATDDGPISTANHLWTVNFKHDDHFHPVLTGIPGIPCEPTGSSCIDFAIPASGHDFSGDTGYQITLNVSDADGLKRTDTVLINPRKSNLTFSSSVPGGVTFTLDQLPRTGPFTIDTLVGFQHTVVAPPETLSAGDLYVFDHWSMEQSPAQPQQTIIVPAADVSYFASYVNAGPATSPKVYLSSASNGTVDGVQFADEDILAYDIATDSWSMFFDGSDVGLANGDVDGFHVMPDGAIYLSLDQGANLPVVGNVDDSDILLFTPTSTGITTAGSLSLYFDGSDFGLTTKGEDVDAISFAPDGRLVISTAAGFAVPKTGGGTLKGRDEHLIVFSASDGTFELYFDGADVALRDSSEDITGASIDPTTGDIYLTTLGNYAVTGLSGDSDDVFVFRGTTGSNTSGTLTLYFDGDTAGFPSVNIDGLTVVAVGSGPQNQTPLAGNDFDFTVVNTPIAVSVLANDFLGDLPTTIIGVTQAGHGTVTSNGAIVNYDPQRGFTGADTFSYTIADRDGETSTATVTVTVAAEVQLITNGLVLRLDAQTGVTKVGSDVLSWSDQSGNGNDLTSLGDPQLVSAGLNGLDTISFDGATDQLLRTTGLSAFPTGAADRSAFVVTKYNGPGDGGVTYGTPTKNKAFGLIVSPGGNLKVQGWGGVNDFISNTPGTAAGWLVQSAIVQNNVLKHYKDGAQIDVQSHIYNTTGTGSLVIGVELDGAPMVNMEIAEVLIYDRALTDQERQQVDSYLWSKYFTSRQSLNPTFGLTTRGEDVVAISFAPNERLVVSTAAGFAVPKSGGGTLKGRDEHLSVFKASDGTFEPYFDGDTAGILKENFDGLSISFVGQSTFSEQNPTLRQDVNANGSVSSLDALLVINQLASSAQSEPGLARSTRKGRYFTDVNGDGRTTALDALQVINYLQTLTRTDPKGRFANAIAGQLLASEPFDEDDDDLVTLLANDVSGILT